VHRVDDPDRWSSGREGRDVLLFPSLWWPPVPALPTGTAAVLLYGIPPPRRGPAGVPTVAGVDTDLVLEGEQVEVNGSKGTLSIEGVEVVPVVTAILEREDGKILLLERSRRVGSFRGQWAGVSGYLEGRAPVEQIYREIREELGLDPARLELIAGGEPVLARDGSRVYVVHPFRFRLGSARVRLDWENVRAEWVDPAELRQRKTVPKLDRVWESLGGALRPKA
jgi:8-oxo-dGTP pyrophosphatase MutT (NUDIX family)